MSRVGRIHGEPAPTPADTSPTAAPRVGHPQPVTPSQPAAKPGDTTSAMRQLLAHSTPGSPFAAKPGSTVRHAALQTWGRDPLPAVVEALAADLPHVRPATVASLVERGMFAPLLRIAGERESPVILRTRSGTPAGRYGSGKEPEAAAWLRAFETASRIRRLEPREVPVARLVADHDTAMARAIAARERGLARVDVIEPGERDHEQSFDEMLAELESSLGVVHKALAQLENHPEVTALALIQALEASAPALAGKLDARRCLDAQSYMNLLGDARALLHDHAPHLTARLDLVERLATATPRAVRSYEQMVAEGRAMLPAHVRADFAELARLGISQASEQGLCLLELIERDHAAGTQLAGLLALLEGDSGPASEDVLDSLGSPERIANLRRERADDVERAQRRSMLRQRCLSHMESIRDALVATSALPPAVARDLVDAITVEQGLFTSLPDDFRDQLALCAQLVDGQGFTLVCRIESSSPRASFDGGVNMGWAFELGTMLHEIGGHSAETEDPELLAESLGFVRARADSTAPTPLPELLPGRGYRDSEVALRGRVLHPYTLKLYRSDAGGVERDWATEVTAMGRAMFASPQRMAFLAYDTDYFYFLLAGLRPGIGKLPVR